MRTKYFVYLSTIFTVLFTIISMCSFSSRVQATETQLIFLHKQVGVRNEATAEMLQDTKGINGVEFTIVDITNYVRNHPNSLEESLEDAKMITKEAVMDVAIGNEVPAYSGMTIVGRKITQRVAIPDIQERKTEVDGVISLQLSKKIADDDASYLLVETTSVDGVTASENMLIHFPIQDEGNRLNSTSLHIYSKNDSSIEVPVMPAVKKELVSQHQDFNYGERISYQSIVTVPSLIEIYQKFQITDTPDASLAVDVDSIKVIGPSGEAVANALYSVSAQENGFVLTFNPQLLQVFKGKKLRVFYQSTLLKETEPDTRYGNRVYLRYHDSVKEGELVSASKEVTTGGYRFVKVDVKDRTQKLEQAVFVVKNDKGEYLSNDYTWKTTKDVIHDDQLFRTVSNKEGNFEVRGLSYGTYRIEEIQSPEGYKLLDAPVRFKVAKNTYTAGGTSDALLEVLNSKHLAADGTNRKIGSTNVFLSSKLPSTGELTKNSDIVTGSLIMLGIYVVLVLKRKKG